MIENAQIVIYISDGANPIAFVFIDKILCNNIKI